MLSLTPLSGLQAAIKRRNSKARRDSISVDRSNLALPGTIRRFSSSETINSPVQPAAPSVATVSRRSSFSRKIRKISVGNVQVQTDVIDTCCALDTHIAQIKRKLAEFREEDVDMSERVEDLTNALGDLCQNYHISVDCAAAPQGVNSFLHMLHNNADSQSKSDSDCEDCEDCEEEEFQKFCQNHTHLLSSTHRLGYSTLPLPPTRGRGRGKMTSLITHGHPKRSQSYEGHHHLPGSYPLQQQSLTPRNSYPQDSATPVIYCSHYNGYDGHFRHRPLSYQEISYDENVYEEDSAEGSWGELSCP